MYRQIHIFIYCKADKMIKKTSTKVVHKNLNQGCHIIRRKSNSKKATQPHFSIKVILYRGVRSRTAECAYAPPVLKQVGHMPYLKFEIVCFCPC